MRKIMTAGHSFARSDDGSMETCQEIDDEVEAGGASGLPSTSQGPPTARSPFSHPSAHGRPLGRPRSSAHRSSPLSRTVGQEPSEMARIHKKLWERQQRAFSDYNEICRSVYSDASNKGPGAHNAGEYLKALDKAREKLSAMYTDVQDLMDAAMTQATVDAHNWVVDTFGLSAEHKARTGDEYTAKMAEWRAKAISTAIATYQDAPNLARQLDENPEARLWPDHVAYWRTEPLEQPDNENFLTATLEGFSHYDTGDWLSEEDVIRGERTDVLPSDDDMDDASV